MWPFRRRAARPAVSSAGAMSPRVLVITHAPRLRSRGGQPLYAAMGWQDPDRLLAGYVSDVEQVSGGQVHYHIVEHLRIDGFPLKADGFRYDEASYLQGWQTRQFHLPDGVDYHALLKDFDILAQIQAARIDEVWLMGFPYAGYYESIMGGPGAVWCNAPPLQGTESAGRRFVIMGFNYERGVGEMLEDLGHRAESILAHLHRGLPAARNLWERFTRYDKTHPGQAECGNVHFAPNSERDYDWGNRRRVLSRCGGWLRFPEIDAPPRTVNCEEWGGGDIRAHHRWWFEHFPRLRGQQQGITTNWWAPVIDPQQII